MTWYRSLYWRIAFGFIASLAVLLLVQGMLFVWMMAKAGSTVPNQPPERFAQTVAVDVEQALSRDAGLDIDAYVRQEYANDSQPFLILLVDGRTLELGARFPEALKAEGRLRLDALRNVDADRFVPRGPFGRGGRPSPGEPGPQGRSDRRPELDRRGGARSSLEIGPEPPALQGPPGSERRRFPAETDAGQDRRPFGRGGPAFRAPRPAAIVFGNRVVGLVLVPSQPPFTFLLTRYAPTLVTVAAFTLIVGGVLAAFVVFGPARRRLKEVEDAARRLGAGDLHARAPVTGNDEVTAVASAFNAMAQDLSARTAALMDADRSRRQLLADVSHELNTPVTAMRGYLETLAMPELNLDQATRAKYLSIVADETARLERTIVDLLELARLEGGGGTLRLEKVRVSELFDRVTARHEQAARAAGVSIVGTVQPGADTLAVDRTRFEQVLQNLAANALRYSPPATTIELKAERDDGDRVRISVADQGAGIPPEHVSRVFDRFYKVDSSRAAQLGEAAGSGLGLSIVRAIVERHGARISVESQPGRTIFTIHGLATQCAREGAALVPLEQRR